jgi:hypothetical protein
MTPRPPPRLIPKLPDFRQSNKRIPGSLKNPNETASLIRIKVAGARE